MIYREEPVGFNPKFEAVGCHLECDGKILLLLRQDHKKEGNKWGEPGGRIENGETALQAIVREIKEETGVDILPDKFVFRRKLYVRYPSFDFVWHCFHVPLAIVPPITLQLSEHKEFSWVSPKQALEMSLMLDEGDNLKIHYNL